MRLPRLGQYRQTHTEAPAVDKVEWHQSSEESANEMKLHGERRSFHRGLQPFRRGLRHDVPIFNTVSRQSRNGCCTYRMVRVDCSALANFLADTHHHRAKRDVVKPNVLGVRNAGM